MVGMPMDDINNRARMEASENTGVAPQGSSGCSLHRVDPGRVAQTLGSAEHAGGFARLELVLNSILPRLVGEPNTHRDAS